MGDNVTNTVGTTSGTSSQSGSSLVQKDPFAGSLPYMQNLAGQAQGLYNNNSMNALTLQAGNWWQPYDLGSQYLAAAPNGITGQMQTPLSQLGQISGGANGITTGGGYQNLLNQLQPTQAGGLTDTQQAILNDNASRLGNRLASQYSGSGRYGSFGAGEGLARGIAETNNPLMAQFNQQNIGNTLAGLGGLSNVQQQNIGNQMGAANSQLNAYNQGTQNIQRQMALQPQLLNMYTAPAQAEWQSLQNYAGALGSTAPFLANTGNVTTNSNAVGTNIGGTTGATSTPTPWTTFAGLGLAGIGAASNIFSDRRLKTDIKKVGKDPWTNLSMYQWRYKGQPKNTPKFVGPMAQEVREKYPEAVGETPEGILYLKKKVA